MLFLRICQCIANSTVKELLTLQCTYVLQGTVNSEEELIDFIRMQGYGKILQGDGEILRVNYSAMVS